MIKIFNGFLSFCFIISSVTHPAFAQMDTFNLPPAGSRIELSQAYKPMMIQGLTIHKDNPFLFDFIVSHGQDQKNANDFKKEGEKLIKYFLASLAMPSKDIWVNLSPYEKNRIIPDALGKTDMGRDLLAQDYVLKQLTASLIYPEKDLGKKFWDKVYAKTRQMYGDVQVPVNTFNKVWIVADRAEVFERNQTVFVVGSHLKVMLEQDYLASGRNKVLGNLTQANQIGSQVVHEIILPELEKEVNQGKNFAKLRQIFNSLILANWYKNNLKEALLNQAYSNQAKVKGIDDNDQQINQKIYEQYLKAYKKGVFNYIKEDIDQSGQQATHKYFSGGFDGAMKVTKIQDRASLTPLADDPMSVIEAGADLGDRSVYQKFLQLLQSIPGKDQTISDDRWVEIAEKLGYLTPALQPEEKITDPVIVERLSFWAQKGYLRKEFADLIDNRIIPQILLKPEYFTNEGIEGIAQKLAEIEEKFQPSQRPSTQRITVRMKRNISEKMLLQALRHAFVIDVNNRVMTDRQRLEAISGQSLSFDPRAMDIDHVYSHMRDLVSGEKLISITKTQILRWAEENNLSDDPVLGEVYAWIHAGSRELRNVIIENSARRQGISFEQCKNLIWTYYFEVHYALPKINYFEKIERLVATASKDFDFASIAQATRPLLTKVAVQNIQSMLRVIDSVPWQRKTASLTFSEGGFNFVEEMFDQFLEGQNKEFYERKKDGIIITNQSLIETLSLFLKAKIDIPQAEIIANEQTQIQQVLPKAEFINFLNGMKKEEETAHDLMGRFVSAWRLAEIARPVSRVAPQQVVELKAQKDPSGEFAQIFNYLKSKGFTFLDISSMLPQISNLVDEAMKTVKVSPQADKAVTVWHQGGIDLDLTGTGFSVRKDGRGVEMTVDSAMIARVKREGINRLSPIIFSVTQVQSIWPLVGLNPPD